MSWLRQSVELGRAMTVAAVVRSAPARTPNRREIVLELHHLVHLTSAFNNDLCRFYELIFLEWSLDPRRR